VRTLVSILVSLGGTAMVFGLLLAMNRTQEAPEPVIAGPAVEMTVAPKPPPPKQRPQPKEQPRPTSARPAAPPAPMPMMGGGIAAVSLGMPGAQVEFDQSSASALLGGVKASVMTEDSVDSKPRPVRRTSAQYPARARAKGTTGFVTMSILIGERGDVERVKVLRADPAGVFDQAAQDAIRGWQFEPAMYGGQPVKVWASQTIRFELK